MREPVGRTASLPDRIRQRQTARRRVLTATAIIVGVLGAIGSTTVLASTGSRPGVEAGPTSSPTASLGSGEEQPPAPPASIVSAPATAVALADPMPPADVSTLAAAPAVAPTTVPAVATTTAPPTEFPLDAIWVSAETGFDATGDGTSAAPYASISAALSVAPAGSTIVVGAGVYRESLDLERPVSILAAPGPRPWLSGAEVATEWTAGGGRWWTNAAGVTRTGWSTGMIGGEPAGLVDIVAVDGVVLNQVTTAADLGPRTFMVDDSSGRLWLGADPTASIVEVGAREHAINFNSVPGSRLEGIGVRHYVTAPGDRAAVEIRGGGVTLVDVEVIESSNAGIQAIGADIALIGVTARGNGRLGVNAHQADGLIVRGGTFTSNNNEGQVFRGAAGGIKVTASRDIVVESSTSSDNGGSGIWIDMSSVGVTISGNTTDHNSKAGIYVEVSARAVVEGNQATGNAHGIEIAESNDVVVRGNVVTANTRGIWVVDGHRDGETCVDRGINAVYTPPVDSRYGCQWPTVKWHVDNVEVTGNTFAGGDPSDTERAMLEVNHVGHPEGAVDGVDRRRSAEDMNVVTADNHFERSETGQPKWVVAWTGGQSMAVFESLSDFQAATGQGSGSIESS